MTIKELIEKLQQFDQDADVVFQDTDEMMTLHEIETFGYVPTRRPNKVLAINAEYCDNPDDNPQERFSF